MSKTQSPDAVGSDSAAVKTAPAAKPRPAKPKPGQLPPYNVILLDDNDHSYDYVIEMLRALFGYAEEKGFTIAEQIDKRGRAIVLTTHKEKAELKRDQIHAFGKDPREAACKGSMTAVIEPAEG